MRRAQTQISLGNRPVRSESSLRALRVAKGLSYLHADGQDSDQTAQADLSLRWTHNHIAGFVMSRLKCSYMKGGVLSVLYFCRIKGN